MFYRDQLVVRLSGRKIGGGSLGGGSAAADIDKLTQYLEFVAEWLLVEEDPWILVFPVPMEFELSHALHDSLKLFVSHQADDCSPRLWRKALPPLSAARKGLLRVLSEPFFSVCSCRPRKVERSENL